MSDRAEPTSFDDIAHNWAPHARRFLVLVADRFIARVKTRTPGLVRSGFFLTLAFFCLGGLAAWLSVAVWTSLADRGLTTVAAALVVCGGFAVFSALFALAARSRASARSKIEVLEPENHQIEDVGHELITLFKDLTIAAKRSLSPNEVMKPHAVKIAAATTAVGFLIALNLNPGKERAR